MAETSAVKMPLQIYEEVALSRGMLANWLRQPSIKEAIVLDEPTNLARVQRVIAEGYAPDLNDVEIVKIGQDPFLIAAALSGSDRIVVTREVSKPSATRANRKVPDVCTSLGIRTMTDFALFRVLNFSIG